MSAVVQDRVNQPRMIEDRIARLAVAQQIDQRNLVGLRTRQRAHDEVEIGCGKPRPTIRLDHRDLIMSNSRADGKSDGERCAYCRNKASCLCTARTSKPASPRARSCEINKRLLLAGPRHARCA